MNTSPEDTSGPNVLRDAALNAPWNFWRLLHPDIGIEEWREASAYAFHLLGDLPVALAGADDPVEIVDRILTERQFGPDHWRLSPAKHAYYAFARPILPARLRPALRRLLLVPQQRTSLLRWPIEDRYVRYQFAMLRYLLEQTGEPAIPYLRLWPGNRRYALVLTHDIETARGQEFVLEVAALEERYGFRSAFNFVPEDYSINARLIGQLRERGFEIGVHGLRHNGRLFLSRRDFNRDVPRINAHLKRWDAVGFRAPFTHRNPAWMQDLDVEYDSTFFDTDPFETINGGTMSIWPFMMGHFVELPFTLPQDHTLLSMAGERSPRVWLEKINFIERHGGMAMMITHPDYLLDPTFFAVYEEFLRTMSQQSGYWHALPRDVARWWRCRLQLSGYDQESMLAALPGSAVGMIRRGDEGAAVMHADGSLFVGAAG